jgi:hypothetical protein
MDETASPASPAPAQSPVDTQGIKDVLALVIDAAKLGVAAEEGGKLSFSDAVSLVKLVPDLGPAIAGMKLVPTELKELGPAAEADIVAFVAGRLEGSASPKAAAIAAAALQVATSCFSLFQAIQA